jgi:ATP-dependent RNA helicase DeaD
MTSLELLPQLLLRMGFESTTPVQEQSFPILLNDQSLRLVAPTGCGKTLAYLLPLMSKIDAEAKATQLLVVCPTRELAQQVAREARKVADALAETTGAALRVCLVSGGENTQAQKTELLKSPHIVVATPGRIHDLIDRDHFEPLDINALVVDEFDLLLGMGFTEPLERVLQLLPRRAQLCFLSATTSEQPLPLESYLPGDAQRVVLIKEKPSATNEVAYDEHMLLRVNMDDSVHKAQRLLKSLQTEFLPVETGLIFCTTKDTTHSLALYLQENGISAEALSGDLHRVAALPCQRF